MRRIYLCIFYLLVAFSTNAQQIAHNTGFNLYQEYYNPAACGAEKDWNAGTIVRKQWLGFDGSPFLAGAFGDFTLKNKISVIGLQYDYDQLGMFKYHSIRAIYNHKIPLTRKLTLSAALSPEMQIRNISGTFIYPSTPPEEVNITDAAFTFGAGIYLHSPDFTVGISSRQIVESKMTEFGYELKRHYFITGSYDFDFTDNFSLSPMINVKSDAASSQIDFLLVSTLYKKFFLGVGYRLQDAFPLQLGYKNDKFTVAYMYDHTFSTLANYSDGSHEIIFRYGMKKQIKPKVITPVNF